MSTSNPRVAVLGPGGVGGLIGALLARAGHRVRCLAGERTAATLRRDGLRVESTQYGHFTAAVEADTCLREPVDAVFVTVKQTALDEALGRVPADILGDALVVPLLNGLDHLPVLRRRYPAARVVAGTIKVEATRTAPGHIVHTSPFARLELAAPPAGFAAPLDRLADCLRQAGLGVTLRTDETAMIWDKLAFLAPFALLTTRYRADLGAVRSERRPELVAVLDEITAVARAAGAPMTVDTLLSFFDGAPQTMKSSMQRDAEAGRPLELDAIGGAVLRAGAAHGVETPTLARLVAEVARTAIEAA
ncbi:2-dehydropantoate 2-reductase (plasmid) [Streptomyces nigrescens]|uniref:2-dehydropantoate 2-reductase n=1 Tax=Streptomyces nigrescens TaxID=1920 RepID=A0ABM8A6K3_STRNI|nr:2-dehydropantoate 2-reductase [Streptomyces nigrescens]BDM74261.1 2-dehydropantoate 2-reductase [Streptomyces nigrescens]